MDILSIIKENLPEGVEVSDKTLKAIEKEIKQQQGLEFVPKDQYSKKIAIIDDMKAEMEDLMGKAAEVDTYKQKVDSLEGEYKNYKSTKEKEFNDFKSSVETEKTTAAQEKALTAAFKAAGANEKFISLLIDKVDKTKAVFDGDLEKGFTVKNSDDIVKPVKEQYSDIFGTVSTQGANPANPPAGENKPAEHKDMNAFIRGRINE